MIKKIILTSLCTLSLLPGCGKTDAPAGRYIMEHDFADGHIEYWGKKYDISGDTATVIRKNGIVETFTCSKKGNFLRCKPEKDYKEEVILEIINKNTLVERINFGKKESSDSLFIRFKRIDTVELNEEKEKNFNQ